MPRVVAIRAAANPEPTGRRETAERNRQLGRPDVRRIHSEIPASQLEEALDQQSGAEEQREAQRHLRGKQRGARARAAGRGGVVGFLKDDALSWFCIYVLFSAQWRRYSAARFDSTTARGNS